MNVLIIAPHLDDEVLGCGGTIARFADEGHNVYVAVITKGEPPMYTQEMTERGRSHGLKAQEFLRVKETIFCNLPATKLDVIPHAETNRVLGDLLQRINPDILFIPFVGDIHLDHQHTFLSSLVAARPNQEVYPRKIYAYETLSETNWNAPYLTAGFYPNVFIDISNYLEKKMQAFSMYQDQVKKFPHERSIESLKALAILRGSTVYRKAAEAFVVVREVL